jgi:hypothetical protein
VRHADHGRLTERRKSPARVRRSPAAREILLFDEQRAEETASGVTRRGRRARLSIRARSLRALQPGLPIICSTRPS